VLADLVTEAQPRIVVVDHQPRGQHDELLEALAASPAGTCWILGMRAIVGDVPGVWTDEARALFRRHYDRMFWFGDRRVTGNEAVEALASHFGIVPVELGYVSRAAFLADAGAIEVPDPAAHIGVLSVTWFSRETLTLLEEFLQAARTGVTGIDRWHCFLGDGEDGERKRRIVADLRQAAAVHPVSDATRYLGILATARMAVIYSGYNSLLDVLWAGVPALAITRHLENREQATHAALVSKWVDGLRVVDERQVTSALLREELGRLSGLACDPNGFPADGAPRTALALADLLDS
jgi:predicted glycosyltransferase